MNKILIIQTAFIGDVILSTPVIEKLHKYFPDAEIDFLLRKGNESLFHNHPFINRLITWDKSVNKYKNLFKALKQIRNNRYDIVINLQRFFSTGMLTVFSKGKITIGFNKNPLSFLFAVSEKHSINNIHETERNLALISSITDNNNLFQPRLYPSAEDRIKTESYKTKQYICIAPASVWFTKQYPEGKWIEFINEIPREYDVYLIGSKDDYNLCQIISGKSGNKNIINLCGTLSLLETASLLKDATMNYANDSAPMHIASAVNAPVTAVYCSTIPDFGFGPLSKKSYIVETKENLYCRPCGLHGLKKCPEKHFNCALSIKKEQLLQTLKYD